MKPRVRFWNNKWWARRMGVTGCGDTIEDAVADMWKLYRKLIRDSVSKPARNYRQGN